MNELLKTGQVVQAEISGHPCQVEKFLGGGGQGEVYQARWAGGSFAPEMVLPANGHRRPARDFAKPVADQPPSDAFLWPLDMATAPGVPGFGYLMRLREPRFKGLLDLMNNRIDPKFRVLATVGLGLADSFFKLHAKGLCYRDISFGNAFFDPDNGDVADLRQRQRDHEPLAQGQRAGNAGFHGTGDRSPRGPAQPADRFVLLVRVAVLHLPHPPSAQGEAGPVDPLLGPAFAREAVRHRARFHLRSRRQVERGRGQVASTRTARAATWRQCTGPSSHNSSGTPLPRAFTSGLKDPENGRVTEGEWRKVLSQLRDSIFYCASCGSENFHDPDAVKAEGGKPGTCWSCKNELRLPFHIRVGKAIVMLPHDGKLYPHHLDPSKDFNFATVCAEVSTHPTDANIWGLKNCTDEKWVTTMPDGSVKNIEPGRSVRLADKTKVHFGKLEGEIRY